MKIALVISGNLRTFSKPQQKISISEMYKKIVNKYNIDTFAYTDTNDFFYNNDINDINDDDKKKEIILNILKKTFGSSLKNFQIDTYKKNFFPIIQNNKYHTNYINYNSGRKMFGRASKCSILNMSYKTLKCYELLCKYEKNNNMKYDIIIKTRFDCVPVDIINNIDITKFDYSNNFICMGNSHFLFDHGVIGNRLIMKEYCNYYNKISPNITNNIFKKWCKQDISDSAEFGLTYLVCEINKMKLQYPNINFRGMMI